MPIVVIAEHCCYTDQQRARQAGCDEVFTKPYSLDWLKERVNLDTVEYCFDKSIYRILVSRVSFFYQAVGNDHAYCHGLVPHQTAQACQGRTFHLEVGDAVAVVFKFFNLIILMRVGKRHA